MQTICIMPPNFFLNSQFQIFFCSPALWFVAAAHKLISVQMLVSDNRGSFIQFLMLLVVHHPSERLVCFLTYNISSSWCSQLLLLVQRLNVLCSEESRCRKGSANLLVNLAELWPAGQVPTAAFLDHPLCGSGLPRNFWVCFSIHLSLLLIIVLPNLGKSRRGV